MYGNVVTMNVYKNAPGRILTDHSSDLIQKVCPIQFYGKKKTKKKTERINHLQQIFWNPTFSPRHANDMLKSRRKEPLWSWHNQRLARSIPSRTVHTAKGVVALEGERGV